jgi:ribosome recycling factor
MSKPDTTKFRDRMEKAVDALKEEFAGLRTVAPPPAARARDGRGYGSKQPAQRVASINVPEPRMITVSVWDKSMTGRWRRRSAPPAWA